MVGLTPVSTVGCTKYPPRRSAGQPPAATVALSAAAPFRNDSTLRYCGSVATGPISVSGALGSPSRIDRARSTTRSTGASWTFRLTSRREPAMQVCPVAAKTPARTPLQAASRSASSNTTWADLPPSSSSTPVMLAAAAGRRRLVTSTADQDGLAVGAARAGPSAARRRRCPSTAASSQTSSGWRTSGWPGGLRTAGRCRGGGTTATG